MKTAARAMSLPERHPLAQAIALVMAISAGATQAAVFNVNTSADSGPGSLREAVLDANANPGADQITFDDGLGTIALTSGQIDITESLTITGPAAGQTIDAGGNSRILAVTVADQPLTVENLTLTGGRTEVSHPFPDYPLSTCADDFGHGGGVCALGDLTLIDSTISGNSTVGESADGGGVHIYRGNATLINSFVSGNSTAGDIAGGGGLSVGGIATLINSTVSSNHTAGEFSSGGGLFVQGGVTLNNSTVSGNSTAWSGGGFLLRDGDAALINSTVSGNSATGNIRGGGAFFVLDGNATLTNSTVTANQSAVGAGGIEIEDFHSIRPGPVPNPPEDLSVNLAGTVLAANSGPEGNFDADVAEGGSITLNASNSLFGDDPAEIDGVNIDNVFTDVPGLAPLANNGCSALAGAPGNNACVKTHALLADSPAIDAADDTVCVNEPVNGLDQRGEMRPADGNFDDIAICDIGAYERQAVTQSIDYDITGSWYNPATTGQGFSIEVVPDSDVLVVYWFTYNLDGSAQMWLQGAGAIDEDVAQVPLQRLVGGRFVDPLMPPMRTDWGTVTVNFFSNSSGEAIYDSPVDGVTGVIPIQRITPAIACSEASAPLAGTIDARFTGSWYDAITDGQGFSLEVIPESDVLVVYWFTYTTDGIAQMWLQGAGSITGTTATVELARPIGGQFDDDSVPTRPVWGTITIEFDSSTSGLVAYDSPLDGIGGCFPIQRITPQAFCE